MDSPPVSKASPARAPSIVCGAGVAAATRRLESLDALRGFDMLWIVGADALGGAFRNLEAGSVGHWIGWQLEHSAWEGFTFYDLIFPLFVFILGVSLTFSLGKLVEREGRGGALARVFRRALLMYVLGLLYYGGFSTPVTQFRLFGVLQRLALCYFFASLLFVFLRPRALIAVSVALLVGYWALLTFVPVPGFGVGDLAEGHNLANWIDKEFVPGRLHHGDHDPEGLLSTVPAIVSCLIGVITGGWLRQTTLEPATRSLRLVWAGVALLALGYAWGVEFPIIKKLWTSSYVLVAGGWSLLLLAAFYHLIDVRGRRGWAQPCVWVGTNALTIYLVSRIVDFNALSARFAGGDIAAALNRILPGLGGLVLALVGVALCVLLCRFLYRRQLFLRL